MHKENETFNSFFTQHQLRVAAALERILPLDASEPSKLHQAMRYALLNGGKRIRPLLIYAVGATFKGDLTALDACACAVEIIHCYSLIHDDLPAMDNDDLRRGLPTCHKAFDEATAILAGDALQALAFEVLANESSIDIDKRLKMIHLLAQACGLSGMAGGQALDMQAEQHPFSIEYIETMHRKKTGALITASVALAALASHCSYSQYQHLKDFADYIGLAFQIQDDILDIESATEILGKQQGADLAAGKLTYPQATSLTQAKARVAELHQHALHSLAKIKMPISSLVKLSHYLMRRKN